MYIKILTLSAALYAVIACTGHDNTTAIGSTLAVRAFILDCESVNWATDTCVESEYFTLVEE